MKVVRDLEPVNGSLWDRVAHRPMPLTDAIRRAILDDDSTAIPSNVLRRRLETLGLEHGVSAAP